MNRLQTADEPVVNRGSTAGLVPPPVYIGIPLFVLAQGCAEAYQACRGVGVLVPGHALHEKGSQRQKGVGSLVSSQQRRALPVPMTNRLSTAGFAPAFGLHRISLVRASGETFRRRVFDALEGTSEACSLDEQFCWHLLLPDSAPPPRRAPRPDPPVVCPGFKLDSIPI